ncbi:MAG: TPM domain-containing protein [Bacteroidetes bacterium]|nr:TPM domain-containing protein [Bacteroidota bacterium]
MIRNWILVYCLFVTLPVWAAVRDTIPRPVGYVNDFEHLFTSEQVDTLDELLHGFKERTSIEIAVLTVDTALAQSANFDFFTMKTMDAWGVGRKGVLIGVSKMFRKIRIQNGAEIEKVMPNAETKKVIDEAFIPLFKKGQYFEGVYNGLKTLIQRLE